MCFWTAAPSAARRHFGQARSAGEKTVPSHKHKTAPKQSRFPSCLPLSSFPSEKRRRRCALPAHSRWLSADFRPVFALRACRLGLPARGLTLRTHRLMARAHATAASADVPEAQAPVLLSLARVLLLHACVRAAGFCDQTIKRHASARVSVLAPKNRLAIK